MLIPASVKPDPDPDILSLERMDVTVRIDHLHARVDMKSIFANHTGDLIEGKYVLPLGDRTAVEDFSVWQGEERLVGTIVEKKKGKRLFEQIVAQQRDPGLAESDDDADKAKSFTVRVAPIPAYGTARVEVTFSEDLIVTSRGVLFTLPFKPRRYGTQQVGALHLDVAVDGPYPLASVKVKPQGALRWSTPPKAGGTRFAGTFDGKNVTLSDDFTIEMTLGDGAPLDVLAYRDPAPAGRKDISPFGDGTVYKDDRGYFMSRAVQPGDAAAAAAPRDVVVLLDTSLSMQWDKLERSFGALEYFLGRLGPNDRFAVAPFSDDVRPTSPDLVAASSSNVAAALKAVRDGYLGGGTDLGQALASGLALLGKSPRQNAQRYLVLISDGNPTLGEIGYRKIGEGFARANVAAGGPRNNGSPLARLFLLGVGDDAATPLLDALAAAGDGYFAWVREGSDASFMLRTFFDKLGQSPLRDVALAIANLAGVTQVYPETRPSVFAGSDATFFGRYAKPGKGSVSLVGRAPGQATPAAVGNPVDFVFPDRDATRPWVARGWARYRIDALLDKIATDGETPELVKEIIALAKEFHFVTPYTSFIAAPRSLLRPRVIQPGDPVLRVQAPPGTRAVVAVFPFGLTQSLAYLPSENLWETRFVAPTWMVDGTYHCLLVLTDADGREVAEDKSFVIDSKPPTVRAELAQPSAHAGDTVAITVHADADTRRITARIGDGPSSEVVWDAEKKASTGVLVVPADAASGSAVVTVTAEDMAHNVASAQIALDVMGGR